MTDKAEFERLLDVYGFRCERFGQDLSTHARAQVVSAFAALASAPVAELRLEWSAKALYDAIKDVLLNHRLSNLVDEDGEFFPLVDHLCSQDDQTTESGEFEIALICDAIYNDVLTKSAPVAGEAKKPVAWMLVGRLKNSEPKFTLADPAGIYESVYAPLYAAPQASALAAEYTRGRADGFDAGQSAALEKAAQVAYEALHPANPRSDWTEYAEHSAQHAAWAAHSIRALKPPQADKDGGQQRNWVSDWSAAIKSLPMGRSAAAVDKSPNLQGSSVDRSADLQGGGDDVVLPPLPSPPVHRGHALFAGSQMQTYARAAVLADRQQRAGDELTHLRAEIQRLRNGVDQDMAEVGRLQALYDSEWRKRQKLRAAFDHPVFAFLLGEGQLHGVDFGERAPGAVGKWWWRKDLRAALSAPQAEQGDTREA